MKLRLNKQGFSAVEALLILVILGIVGFTGWFVYHSKQATDRTLSSTPSSSKNQSVNATSQQKEPKPTVASMHTNQEALTFVQNAYDSYQKSASQVHEGGVSTSLEAIKPSLSPAFYNSVKTAYAQPASDSDRIDCEQNTAIRFSVSPASSTSSSSAVLVVIDSGYSSAAPFKVTVDLKSLLITNVTCP